MRQRFVVVLETNAEDPVREAEIGRVLADEGVEFWVVQEVLARSWTECGKMCEEQHAKMSGEEKKDERMSTRANACANGE